MTPGPGPGGPGSAAGCAGAHAASSPLQGQLSGQSGVPCGGAARDVGASSAMTSGRDERGSDAPSSATAAVSDPSEGEQTEQQQAEAQAALRARLVSLLCAYAAHDPDTGYCQGRVRYCLQYQQHSGGGRQSKHQNRPAGVLVEASRHMRLIQQHPM